MSKDDIRQYVLHDGKHALRLKCGSSDAYTAAIEMTRRTGGPVAIYSRDGERIRAASAEQDPAKEHVYIITYDRIIRPGDHDYAAVMRLLEGL